MVLHNPNNWHWVNKDASGWTKEWLEENLVGVSAEEGDVTAKIDKVVSMDGDVDVNQRKGKVITLFDVKVDLEYSGKTKDGEDVSGTIKIPEVAHDTEEDEYVFDIDIFADASNKQPVKDLVRSKITPQLRSRLIKLGPALIAEHGKDIQHAPGSGPSSGVSTPTYKPPPIAASHGTTKSSATTTTTTTSSGKGPSINTVTLHETTEFQTTAAELYQTFTDPSRLAAFTRAPPKVFEGAKVGGKFELFGGNVSGEYVDLKEPTKIVQSWRLSQWPQEHYSKLSIGFDQNDVDAVTVMRVSWEGVPVGQEEVTRRNWGEYYVRSIKTTFGRCVDPKDGFSSVITTVLVYYPVSPAYGPKVDLILFTAGPVHPLPSTVFTSYHSPHHLPHFPPPPRPSLRHHLHHTSSSLSSSPTVASAPTDTSILRTISRITVWTLRRFISVLQPALKHTLAHQSLSENID